MLLSDSMKIGVMGAKGSFSEKAGEEYIAEHGVAAADIVPLVSAEAVLSAVEDDNYVYQSQLLELPSCQ